MSQLLNLIQLNNASKASQAINTFLNRRVMQDSTRVAYTSDIKQFFGVKEIEHITDKQFTSVEIGEVERYLNEMDEEYAPETVARKLGSLKAMYSYIFNGRFKDENGELLLDHNPIANVEYVSEGADSYGAFTMEEVKALIEVARPEDGLYFETLVRTGVRSESVLALNINDIQETQGLYVWIGKEKGRKGKKKEFKATFTREYYNRLRNAADETGKVFNMKRQAVLDRLCRKTSYTSDGKIKTNYKNSYCSQIGISEEECKTRNLVLHSFKKTGVTFIKHATNDAYSVIKFAKNDAKYALNTYVVEDNPYDDPSLLIDFTGNQVEKTLQDELENMSKEELIKLIMRASDSTKRDLANRL